jgi:hypothetical protein
MPMTDGPKMTIEELVDREAIRDCLTRYSRAIDRRDPDLLRTVYWPDATDDHVAFKGPATEFISWCMATMEPMELVSHMLGNMLIEVDGAEARVETYFQAYHRIADGTRPPYDLILGGRYLDRMGRRDGDWRIQERRCVFDWYREFADSADWSKDFAGVPFRPGGRKPNDLVYAFLGRQGS